jgi:hypothetical protein
MGKKAFALPVARVSALVTGLVGVVLAGVPLFGVHGVESAIALGVLVPPLAALVAARLSLAARRAAPGGDASETTAVAVVAALTLLAIPVVVLAVNALRVKNCAPLEGLTFVALGPGMGVILAALVGCMVGRLPIAPARASVVAPALVVIASLVAIVRIWATPAVFAYGHFFGYFPGSLYDEIVPIPTALWNLRVVTVALVFTCLAFLRAHVGPRGTLRLGPSPGRTALSAFACLGLGAGIAGEVFGTDLGFRTTTAHVERALGDRVTTARCELVFPREMSRARLARLADDCDFRVAQMERWLGLRQPGRVRVILFRSSEEKRLLMGAAATNIAKPWRREVYLQDRPWPHPVLAHEIAHVVAGNCAPGPFRLSGRFGGWWPDPVLVEGIAVAAAWGESSQGGLTPHQWARAAIELDLAPPLADLFGSGFFGQDKALAYTLAGSLLRWLADTEGAPALRRVYRTGDLARALGRDVRSIERDWRAHVAREPLPDAARALAELRFSGGSIVSSICPHQVAERKEVLGQDLASGDDQGAATTCRDILAMDARDAATRATFVVLLARGGDVVRSNQEFSALEADKAPRALLSATRQALADEAWRAGRRQEAAREYEGLLSAPQGRDARRLLQVKALAAAGPGRQAELLFGLLVGQPGVATDGATAVHLARELRAERDDGLAHYLEARQLFNQARFAETARLLSEARALGLPTSELAAEAMRVEATSRYASGNHATARALWGRLWREGDLAQRAEAADWLARVRHLGRP